MKPTNDSTRGRPRDEALTTAILNTTLELLADRGFRDMHLEDVADRVGTSKQALYRRWPNKSALVAEAVRAALTAVNPHPPDTGSLRDDLVALLSNTVGLLRKGPFGGAIRALVGEASDSKLSGALHEVERERRKLLRAVLLRARRRGEVDQRRDMELDIDFMLGAIYFRLLVRRKSLSPDIAARIVDAWWQRSSDRTHPIRAPL